MKPFQLCSVLNTIDVHFKQRNMCSNTIGCPVCFVNFSLAHRNKCCCPYYHWALQMYSWRNIRCAFWRMCSMCSRYKCLIVSLFSQKTLASFFGALFYFYKHWTLDSLVVRVFRVVARVLLVCQGTAIWFLRCSGWLGVVCGERVFTL